MQEQGIGEVAQATGWFVAAGSRQQGPMSLEEVGSMLARGAIGPETLCWKNGMAEWQPLSRIPELASLLSSAGSDAAPPVPPAPPYQNDSSHGSPAPGPAYTNTESKTPGFFGSLFDLSFSSFVTTKIISVLYVLMLIGAGLTALAMFATGPFVIILGPLVFIMMAVYGRVTLELIIVVFRIAENMQITATQLKTIASRSPMPEPVQKD